MNLGFSVIWRLMQQYSVFAIKLIVQIVLARIITAEENGLIGLVLVFASVAEMIAGSGLGTALVQKHSPDDRDYGTVMVVSLGISAVMYVGLFVMAPVIADFYDSVALINILRIYCCVLFSQAYLGVLNAYVQKNFLFQKSFIGNLIAVLVAGVIAVFSAYQGAGVWAMVLYGMLSSVLSLVFVQMLIRWRPKVTFSRSRFQSMFSFGWKVLASGILGTLLENIYNLTIGKYYGNATLGYYKQGNTYPDAILGQTRNAFGAVMLPIYSSHQHNKELLRDSVYKMSHVITLVIFPMAVGLAAVADNFVTVLLTDKWLPSVFFLRLECLFFGTLPITTSLGSAITAIGRSDISMKIELVKLVVTVLAVVLLNEYGVAVLCVARVLIAVAFVIAYCVISYRVIGLNMVELLRSVSKPFVLSAVMGFAAYYVSYVVDTAAIVEFVLQVLVGLLLYLGGIVLFMKEDIQYVKSMVTKER